MVAAALPAPLASGAELQQPPVFPSIMKAQILRTPKALLSVVQTWGSCLLGWNCIIWPSLATEEGKLAFGTHCGGRQHKSSKLGMVLE